MNEATQKTSLKFKLLFSTKIICICVTSVLGGYVTLYATNVMGMSAATVGIVFMVSKIFDGFTDFVAGMIIDHTHTKWGQARPYELAMIGYSAGTVLMFSAPEMSQYANIIYLFVIYTMTNSVFLTLVQCNEAPYLSNSINDTRNSVDVVSFSSVISLAATLIASIVIPQLISDMGTSREGWRLISIALMVPFTLIGLIRFAFIKEIREMKIPKGEKMNLLQDVKLLLSNKYAMLFGVILLLGNICGAVVNMNYYCIYFLGDIGFGSLLSLSILGVIIIMVIMPKLSKKFGTMNVVRFFIIAGAMGNLLKLISPTNISVVFISNFLSDWGYLPLFMIANSILIDIMDYSEWKFGKRSQGTISCLSGIGSKIGSAAGAFVLGNLLTMAGFDGMAEVQSKSAMNMILGLVTWVPAIICVIMLVLSFFYNLDKKLPQIREELDAKKGEAEKYSVQESEK